MHGLIGNIQKIRNIKKTSWARLTAGGAKASLELLFMRTKQRNKCPCYYLHITNEKKCSFIVSASSGMEQFRNLAAE